MYTVVRFLREPFDQKLLESIGEGLNRLIPGTYDGIRARGDGFACDVSSSDLWFDHHAAIERFIASIELAS